MNTANALTCCKLVFTKDLKLGLQLRHILFSQAHFCEATTQIRMERWKETILAHKIRQSCYQLPIHECKYFLYEIKQEIIDSLWSIERNRKQKLIEMYNNNDWNMIIWMKTLCLVLRLIFRVIWLKLLMLMTINMIWQRMFLKICRNTSASGSWLRVNSCIHRLDHSSARTINYFDFSHEKFSSLFLTNLQYNRSSTPVWIKFIKSCKVTSPIFQ